MGRKAMRTTIASDIHAAAAMADNLLGHGVSVFKAVLIRETGQYRVSWETNDEGLYNLERDQQPNDRNNGNRPAGDHPA